MEAQREPSWTTTDYRSAAATLNFAAGQTAKTVTVRLVDNSVHERSENFSMNLTQTLNADLGDGVGTATIRPPGAQERLGPVDSTMGCNSRRFTQARARQGAHSPFERCWLF